MPYFYLKDEELGAVLNQDEYNELRKRNGELYKLHCLGEFVDKSQARRFFHQSYLPNKKKESEVGNGESDTEIPRSEMESC